MTIRPILTIPDPLLKRVSEPIEEFDEALHALIDDMFETMYAAPGIGLAAIQIGVAKRLFICDVSTREEPDNPVCFINPEITWASEETNEHEEGCLSIPEVYDMVTRPSRVSVSFTDKAGAANTLDCEGLLATCVQHEIDHLNGVLFIDHLSRLKKDRVIKKFQKTQRQDRS